MPARARQHPLCRHCPVRRLAKSAVMQSGVPKLCTLATTRTTYSQKTLNLFAKHGGRELSFTLCNSINLFVNSALRHHLVDRDRARLADTMTPVPRCVRACVCEGRQGREGAYPCDGFYVCKRVHEFTLEHTSTQLYVYMLKRQITASWYLGDKI